MNKPAVMDDAESLLGAVLANVFQARSVTEGRVLHTPTLDALVDRIGRGVASYDTLEPPHPGSHVIVGTEFYTFGGHGLIARQLQQHTRASVVCTDLHRRYETRSADVVPVGEKFMAIKEPDLVGRVRALRTMLLALRPQTVWLLAHHYDVVACAAVHGLYPGTKVFVHHADHSVSLGSARRDYVHIDLEFPTMGTIAGFCRAVGKVHPVVVPMSGSADIAESVDPARAQTKLDGMLQRKRLASVTAGTPNKFRFDGPLALPTVLGRLFASRRLARHLHIGQLPADAVETIQREARAHGVDFRHMPVSSAFAADLVEYDADLYLGSFPVGGGSAMLAAIACGMLALWFEPARSGTTRADWSFGTIRPEIAHWDSVDTLLAALGDRALLQRLVELSRRLARQAFDASTGFAAALVDAVSGGGGEGVAPQAPQQRATFHAARLEYRRSYAQLLRGLRARNRIAGELPSADLPAADGPLRWLAAGEPAGAPTAVILHLHYADLWPEFAALIARLAPPVALYVSLTDSALDALPAIRRDMPRAAIALSANAGRDIAPRLALLRRARSCPDHRQVLFVHGKKSPHLQELRGRIAIPFLQHCDGDRWRRELLAALVDSAPAVLAAFAAQPTLGMVGPRGFALPLQGDSNLPRVVELCQRMGFGFDPASNGYFAGSMFWCRPTALDPLLALDLDFEPETGQVDGTLAHAIERAFGLVVAKGGFRVDETPAPGALLVPAPLAPAHVPVQTAAAPAAPPALPWMPQYRLSPHEREWADEFMREAWSSDGPRIALALLASNDAGVSATMDSLGAQWFAGTVLMTAVADSGSASVASMTRRLQAAQADWVGVVDAGDRLAPDALFRMAQAIRMHPDWAVVYCDEDSITPDGTHVNPHCKPDFNLDYLRSLPYIGGLLLIRRDLFDALGGFDPQYDGAEDYDLLLRAWEQLLASGAGETAIGHVHEVLYHRMQGSGHTRKTIPDVLATAQAALQAHFHRMGVAAEVQPGPFPPSFRVRWPLPETRPLVSIIIPTRDQLSMLQRCVESLIEKTRYPAYEVLIVDNDSRADDAVRYLDAIESREAELGGRLRVIRAPGEFNFSAMNNSAARAARGEYLLLLNNDTAALHEDWLDEMMGHAVRPDVGAVGAKLLFPDGKIQHAGVILGIRGPAEHPFIGRPPEDRGYFGRAQLVQDVSAVTGACLLVRKSVYEQLGGLDEQAFKVSYNDIDLCLKIRAAGLRVVFTPFALLMHEGSASQKGQVEARPDEAKQKRFAGERLAMYDKWLPVIARDPAYNRHLSLASTEFLLDDQICVAWDPEWRPRPRLLAHAADREGCGEYRIIAPMRSLVRAGRVQGWETMRLFDPAEMERISPDSLVVQRQMEWPQIEALERHVRYSKAFRVFEIDDLITNLPLKSVHRPHIHKDITKRFRKAAGLCNRLVVATEPLAKAYAGFSDEVVVCPNYLERARWGELRPARAERSRPRVGWAGGIGHAGDLELIVDVVRETAAEVDWVFFGMCPPELKDVVREFHTGIPLDQYAPKLASLDLDLAVAPLEQNAFNEAKSHLRLLEYGVLGYPVICSDLTPYQGDFPVTRVANRFRDWVRAIRDAVAEPQALRAQGDALRDKVLAHWMLEDHLDDWLRAWTS